MALTPSDVSARIVGPSSIHEQETVDFWLRQDNEHEQDQEQDPLKNCDEECSDWLLDTCCECDCRLTDSEEYYDWCISTTCNGPVGQTQDKPTLEYCRKACSDWLLKTCTCECSCRLDEEQDHTMDYDSCVSDYCTLNEAVQELVE